MMIKNIVCAIDRSPSSLQALGYAIALAKWQDARLILLEVIEEVPAPDLTVAPKGNRDPKETRTALARDLRRVLTARRASDVKVEICMRKGHVVEEILSQAKASRADLVVIGSHGHGGVRRQRLGSIAEEVLWLATCPVLTVRSGVRLARRSGSPFETILCPMGSSPAAKKATAYATRLAQEANATLALLKPAERPPGEPASEAIVEAARARSIDLIVMGASGRDTTHHVIRDGAWPVLTVRTGKRRTERSS